MILIVIGGLIVTFILSATQNKKFSQVVYPGFGLAMGLYFGFGFFMNIFLLSQGIDDTNGSPALYLIVHGVLAIFGFFLLVSLFFLKKRNPNNTHEKSTLL